MGAPGLAALWLFVPLLASATPDGLLPGGPRCSFARHRLKEGLRGGSKPDAVVPLKVDDSAGGSWHSGGGLTGAVPRTRNTSKKAIHLLPWQVVGIGTPGRWSGKEWKDLRYCAPAVSGVATLAFQFQGPLAGPNRSVLGEWLAECKRNQMSVLYEVKQFLFDGHLIKKNVTAVWKEAAEQLRPLVQAGSVMGAFLGDELLWGGLSYPDLVTAVSLVRASFPPPFIIYANEALPVLQEDVNGKGQKVNYAKVPDGQDWLSIDFYSFRVHDSTNGSAESYYSRVLENVYKTNVSFWILKSCFYRFCYNL